MSIQCGTVVLTGDYEQKTDGTQCVVIYNEDQIDRKTQIINRKWKVLRQERVPRCQKILRENNNNNNNNDDNNGGSNNNDIFIQNYQISILAINSINIFSEGRKTLFLERRWSTTQLLRQKILFTTDRIFV